MLDRVLAIRSGYSCLKTLYKRFTLRGLEVFSYTSKSIPFQG